MFPMTLSFTRSCNWSPKDHLNQGWCTITHCQLQGHLDLINALDSVNWLDSRCFWPPGLNCSRFVQLQPRNDIIVVVTCMKGEKNLFCLLKLIKISPAPVYMRAKILQITFK